MEAEHSHTEPENRSTEELVAAARSGSREAIALLRERGFFSRAPLSHAQRRLWFLDRMQAGDPSYNIPGSLLLSGPLQKKALEQALQSVIRRHEILRTVFEENPKGEPVQRILDGPGQSGWKLRFVDLGDSNEPEQAARQLVGRENSVHFDLERGPLFRTTLARLEERRHVLIFNLHHIIFDEWSFDVLLHDLDRAYRSACRSEEPALPPLDFQYKDYAARQNRKLAEGELSGAERFWNRTLEDPGEYLELPPDFRRTKESGEKGATLSRELAGEELDALRAYAGERGESLYTVLMSAFKTVLYRYTGVADSVVGMPVAGRGEPELERQIGFYINTLPLRSRIEEGISFRRLVGETGERIREALAHQDYPFDLMVEQQDIPRSAGRNPLFSTVFNYLEAGEEEKAAIGDLDAEPFLLQQSTAKFDFVLQATERPGRIEFHLTWRRELYQEEKIRGFWRHFTNILAAVRADDGRPLEQLPMVGREEIERLAEETPPVEVPSTAPSHLPGLLDKLAGERPGDVAALLVGNDDSCEVEEELTFGELKEQSDRIATHLLTACGIRPGEIVLCCMERSIDILPVMAGIMKAGGVYLPVDTGQPDKRIAYMAGDSGAGVIITASGLRERLLAIAGDAAVLTPQRMLRNEGNRTVDPGAEDPAYVIYTSGSTGNPKGVVIRHGSLMSMARGYAFGADIPFPERPRGLLFGSLGFDIFFLEILPCFLHGGSIVICGTHIRYHHEALRRVVNEQGVDYLLLTPNVIHNFERRPLPGLSILASGADKADAEDLLHYHRQGIAAYNFYGPTEITVGSTFHRVSEEEEYDRRSIPIGRPIPGVGKMIVDRWGNLMPEGIPGELCISGGHLASRYMNRPELTAEKFPEHPLRSPDRVYKTGDRALRRFDGQFEFLGREDNQVKIGAYRIEIEEIETVLGRHPEVGEAIVTVAKNRRDKDTLVAHIVSDKPEFEPRELRSWLGRQLPHYMIPPLIRHLDRIPRLVNGKPDRSALEALPAEEGVAERESDGAFAGESAKTISRLFEELLGLQEVSRETHFFREGGESLKAARLSSRIRNETGIPVSIAEIFNHPSAGELALLLEQRSPVSFRPITPSGERPHYPVSSAQYRLWVMEQMNDSASAYQIRSGQEIRGPLRIPALAAAYRRLTRRHEALRTTFDEAGDEVVQYINPEMEPDVKIRDLRNHPDPEEALGEFLDEENRRGFDLRGGPPCRLLIFRTGQERTLLMVQMHHIIGDEWSLDLLFDELYQCYLAETGQGEPELSPLPLQYRDYAVWEQEQLADGIFDEAGRFWKELISGDPPPLDLPRDKSRPNIKTYRGAQREFRLDPEQTGRLLELAGDSGVTLFTLLLTSFRLILHRYSRQNDIIIGTPVANRRHPDLEGQIGCFVNMLPLRRSVDSGRGFRGEMAAEGELLQQALDWQGYPFDRLVEELDIRRDPSRSPLFDVGISYGEQKAAQAGDAPIETAPWSPPDPSSRYDMTWYLTRMREGDLRLICEYNTDLFSGARIDTICRAWRALLGDAAEHPERPVSELSLMDREQRETVIRRWGTAERPYPSGETVPGLFRRIAAEYPDHPASADLRVEQSYAELDRRSSNLAGYLREEHGIGQGDFVASVLSKDLRTPLAWLAILKAGAAYVPVDPGSPVSRRRYMFEDSGVSLVITGERGKAGEIPADTEILSLDEAESVLQEDRRGDAPARPPLTPGSPAYLIYTSGSTGRPKGTVIPHRGILRLVKNCNYIPWEEQLRVLQSGSPAFDASTMEVWGALLNGGCICFPPDGSMFEPEKLKEVLRKLNIGAAVIPTGLFHQLVETDPALFSSLGHLLIGGEKLLSQKVGRALRASPGTRFLNGYGPTENTTLTTWFRVEEPVPDDLPIGCPGSNCRVYILDGEGRPVPPGLPGELYVGGDGVALGYLNREELTRERFLPDPFRADGTIYRTGDLCSWNEDGTIRFHGRMDDQVKVNGYRVEPGEVRHRLLRHEAVRQCHIHPRTDASGLRTLIAYYTGRKCGGTELRNWIGEQLPEYMIPSAFVHLNDLPLTVNGKVDSDALPTPGRDDRPEAGAAGADPPQNKKESAVHEAWSVALRRERIGREENYFELGGDSIKAIRCVNLLSARGWKITVADLYANPRIAALADAMRPLERQKREEPESGTLPLNPIQRWFLQSHEEGIGHFNQSMTFTGPERYDPEALEAALRTLVRSHGALRSVFPRHGTTRRQEIRPADETAIGLEIVDLRDSEEPRKRAGEDAALRQQAFDLERGPLFRALLYRLEDGDHLFLLAHHLVVDAVSWHIIREDLETAYLQAGRGEIASPSPSGSLIPWSDWLQGLAGRDFGDRKKAWLDALQGEARLDFLQRTDPHSYGETETVRFDLNGEETARLQGDIHRVYNTNVEDLLLASLSRESAKWSGGERLTLLLEGHGREELFEAPPVTRTVGWFTTRYPCALPLSRAGEGEDLKRVKDTLRRIPDKGITYGILSYIREALPAEEPVAAFNYLGAFGGNEEAGDLFRLSRLDTGEEVSPLLARRQALEFTALISGGTLRVECRYHPDMADATALEQFMEGMKEELFALADHCESSDGRERTASDFTDRELSDDDLDTISDLFS